jgi:hypothetical protein
MPEGQEGRGWRFISVELGKVVAFFDFAHDDGNSLQPRGGRQATGKGHSSAAPQYKEFKVGGLSFAAMLDRVGKIPKCSTMTDPKSGNSLTVSGVC